MECQAAVRATNDLLCGSWPVKGAAGAGVGAVQQVEKPAEAESQQLVQTWG